MQRWKAQIAISFLGRNQSALHLTESVGVDGVFVRTDAPPAPMTLVRIEFLMPPDDDRLVMHGMVASVVRPESEHSAPKASRSASSRRAPRRARDGIGSSSTLRRPLPALRGQAGPPGARELTQSPATKQVTTVEEVQRGERRSRRDVLVYRAAPRARRRRSSHAGESIDERQAHPNLRRAPPYDRLGDGDRARLPKHDGSRVGGHQRVLEAKRRAAVAPGRARPHLGSRKPP